MKTTKTQKTTTQTAKRQAAAAKALRKALKASQHLAEAARLMREAANATKVPTFGSTTTMRNAHYETTMANGHYDYLHWARKIDEMLSCDNGEAGIGPAIQTLAEKEQR